MQIQLKAEVTDAAQAAKVLRDVALLIDQGYAGEVTVAEFSSNGADWKLS